MSVKSIAAMIVKTRSTRTTEAQLFKIIYNLKPPTDSGVFTPAPIRNSLIQGGKPVKNVRIDPQTTEMWLIKQNVM